MTWWFFFFFKQKTAYEMRISDWSSDVCSSDLQVAGAGVDQDVAAAQRLGFDPRRPRTLPRRRGAQAFERTFGCVVAARIECARVRQPGERRQRHAGCPQRVADRKSVVSGKGG